MSLPYALRAAVCQFLGLGTLGSWYVGASLYPPPYPEKPLTLYLSERQVLPIKLDD